MRTNRLGGRLNFIGGGIWLTKGNVVGNRTAKQIGLLRDHDNGSAQVAVGQLAQVGAVQGHAANAWVIEPRNQLGQS